MTLSWRCATRATLSRFRAARATFLTRNGLAQLMQAGRLRASFLPPKAQRQLPTLTRYRTTQIAERQRDANRLHNAAGHQHQA
jgi:hypothetical protein